MKNSFEIAKFLMLFLIVILILLIIEYIFLKFFGFSEKNFFYALVITFVFSIFFGIMLSRFSLASVVETNRLLDRLLKDTLHELNIPLATILANINMLKRGEEDKRRLKRLARIEKASDQLLNLYKDLDYFIKREIQKVDYDIFNLKDLVEERAAFFEDIRGDIEIILELKDLYVKANKRGFLKTIDNLLSNAIKYNKRGGFVKILLTQKELIFEDSGIGMEESKIVKIFERYYQAVDSKSGYGIGLNIVKSFCDDNKISISIDSKVDIGTKIRLNLEKILI
ncbi:MAG TPA: HAMP domain-containing histidine kinase [Campylobacterales bacterium]|nr:HAMP domain-containing histidine kinase [Campylobacterales bacterium]